MTMNDKVVFWLNPFNYKMYLLDVTSGKPEVLVEWDDLNGDMGFDFFLEMAHMFRHGADFFLRGERKRGIPAVFLEAFEKD